MQCVFGKYMQFFVFLIVFWNICLTDAGGQWTMTTCVIMASGQWIVTAYVTNAGGQ